MDNFTAECQNCFFKTNLCKSLSRRELRILFKPTKRRTFERGEVIFKQDEKTEYLVCLTHGLAKLVYHNQGKDLIIAIEKPQTLLGLANVLNGDVNLASMVAVEDCKGCMIDIEKFKEMVIKNRRFLFEVMGISTLMFRRSIFNFISIAHKQSNGRVADVLIFLSENIYNNCSFCLSLSRQELAEFAGCSKELVSRTLQTFCTEGIINISGKNIEILDMEQLYKISKIG